MTINLGLDLGLELSSSDDQPDAAAADAGLGDLEPLTDAAADAGIDGKDFLGAPAAPDAAAATPDGAAPIVLL